jgi:ABC-type Fe3+ transport system substrate-binding protein
MNGFGLTRGRGVAVLCACLAAALTLTACGGGGGAASGSAGSGAALLTSTATNRDSQLVAAAKKEGTLNWVTSFAGPVVNAIVAAFQKQYPYIHLTVNRGDEGAIIPQAIQEITARKPAGDVFEVTASGALELKDAGALVPYVSPNASRIPPAYKVLDGSGHDLLLTDRISYISFGYNTKLVPANAVPRSLQDLLNPALSGKLAVETDTTSEEWVGAVLHKMGPQAGEAFLSKLAAQQHVSQTALSGSALMGLVATGQYAASPSVFHNHQQQNADKGAPVAWVPLDPVVANVGQLGILTNTPHPASAMLFIDFLTSPAGQKVLESKRYTPPEAKQPFTAWVPSQGAKDANAYNDELKQWAALQKKYFG